MADISDNGHPTPSYCSVIKKIFLCFNRAIKMNWLGYVYHLRKVRNVQKILVVKSEGETPLGRPKIRGEIRFRIHVEENRV
jgi:hypothetical protein